MLRGRPTRRRSANRRRRSAPAASPRASREPERSSPGPAAQASSVKRAPRLSGSPARCEPADAGARIQAMPESARPHLQAHIERVIQTAAGLASQMTPEQRAQVTTSPAPEKLGATQQAQIASFGWPNAGGWGGLGAFGFPGFATGYSTGIGISCGYNSQSVNGFGYSAGGCTPPVGYGFGY